MSGTDAQAAKVLPHDVAAVWRAVLGSCGREGLMINFSKKAIK